MRIPVNPNIVENRIFPSWKSENDPSPGNFSMGVDSRAAPQFVIWEGSNRHWRSSYWNGLSFNGVPNTDAFYYYGFKLIKADANGIKYFTYIPVNPTGKFKFLVTWDGYEKSVTWADGGNEWNAVQKEPKSECDVFNKCGVNGYCRNATGDFVCGCFKGFVPKYPDQWSTGNWSGGCVRETQLKCEIKNDSVIANDTFLDIYNVKLPDFANILGAEDKGACANQCLRSFSCRAFAYVSTIGCMVWSGDLYDIQQFKGGGNKLYIRVASSALSNKGKSSGPKIAAIVVSGVVLFSIVLLCLCKFRKKLKAKRGNDALTIGLRKGQVSSTDISRSQEMIGEENYLKDLPLINYNLVASATNFFSAQKKLGEGGFSPVYKGTLPGGQEIAIKKLSRKSGQGMAEFMNEIMLIAKLQHRNLVRILGCCVHEDEKMLLYEYMPNKSLDGLIFDPIKKHQLDWKKRFTIIE